VLALSAIIVFASSGEPAAQHLTPARAAPSGSPDKPGLAAVVVSYGGNREASYSSYWVKEFRRRWQEERQDGKARAGTIRKLRRTLMVRAWKPVIEGVWMALASCESGRRWAYNGSSGFDGGLQFHPGTWRAYRRPHEPAYAYEAPPEVQVAVARRVLAVQGWEAWPACSRRLGLR
jgi:hypothetical protein